MARTVADAAYLRLTCRRLGQKTWRPGALPSRAHAPWGAELRLTEGRQTMGPGVRIAARGPAFDAARRALAEAWGADVVDVGGGGSIPIVTELAAAFPEASLLLTGAADPASRLHAENESVDLDELRRATMAEALLLRSLAESGLDGELGAVAAESVAIDQRDR